MKIKDRIEGVENKTDKININVITEGTANKARQNENKSKNKKSIQ